jgi:hypothetical protein
VTDVKVTKNIPIPALPVRPPGKNMRQLSSMEIGDSIWKPTSEEKTLLRYYRVAKMIGAKILIRKVGPDDPEGPGVRMWRIE